MRKFTVGLLVAGSIFLYAGCPETNTGTQPPASQPSGETPKADTPKTDAPKTDAPKTDAPKTDAPKTDAPKTDAPKATSDVNPLYDSAKVGEVYVIKMNMGMEMTQKHTVKAKDADNLTVEITSEIPNVPAQPGMEQKYPIKMPKVEGTPAAPADAPKPIKSETLTISGVKFECDVYEQDVAGKKMQNWMCKNHYPGLVKTVDADGKTTYELIEIQAAK